MTAEKGTCTVCLEPFREPKVLPCCHTFCLTCLEKTAHGVVQKKGEIMCPQCRKTHPIPAGGLTELLTDFIATYEVEVTSLKSSSSNKGGVKTLICGECEQPGLIQLYCSDCRNYVCDECGLTLHQKLKAYRGHKVVSIHEINAVTLQPCQIHYCKVHKAESLKLYCGTCSKLICRDCTLVEHRQHDYSFIEDARKQVDAEMSSLQSDVKQKLATFRRNLREIRKVEESAAGHAQVLKADINVFFDKLVCSIEARRKVVLEQAETVCQKDLKQIWADNMFHEMTISHISSVFDLVQKARKCTSNSEMILTALQSIHQLKLLHETEWDSDAFTSMVSATPKFIEGEKVVIDAVGGVDHVAAPSTEMQFLRQTNTACLGSYYVSTIKSSPTQILVDERSGAPINLQHSASTDLRASVHYGRSLKQLDEACIHVNSYDVFRYGTSYGIFHTQPKSGTHEVRIGPIVCGGKHIITFRFGYSVLKHTFTVTGEPQHGARVKKGPDWKPKGGLLLPISEESKIDIGTIICYQNMGRGSRHLLSGMAMGGYNAHISEKDMVTVRETSGTTRQYKWGKDGEYEIELCAAP